MASSIVYVRYGNALNSDLNESLIMEKNNTNIKSVGKASVSGCFVNI